jgi:hypothetical protein
MMGRQRHGRFATTRDDGRSNADVLIALVQSSAAGQTYTYDELAAHLAVGTTNTWDRRMVQSAVRASLSRMLREAQRMLHSVIGVGYRVAHGADHSRLALVRERRSQSQLRQAVSVLRNVQWGELTPPQRTLHEAHLTVTAAVCAQVAHVQRRQQRHDDAITGLLSRVEKLESM